MCRFLFSVCRDALGFMGGKWRTIQQNTVFPSVLKEVQGFPFSDVSSWIQRGLGHSGFDFI